MMKKYILLWGSLLVAVCANGQFTSRLGRFQVDQIRGCPGLTVTITNANLITSGECTAGKPCNMDFLGSNPPVLPTNQFTFTYNTPGTYKLIVYYQFIGSDDITITIDPDVKPTFEVYTCSSNQVYVRITDNNYQQYSIDFGDGSPLVNVPASGNQIAQHSYATSSTFTIQVRGRKTNGALNCSPATNAFQAVNTLPNPSFTQLTALDASTAKIDFPSQTNILYRMEIAINSINFQLYQTSIYGVNTFTASNLRLDDNYYCFRLDAYDICTGSHNYSPPICSQKFSLAIQNGVNQLAWQTYGGNVSGFDINRNKSVYQQNLPNTQTSFSDTQINCKTNYCYQVVSRYAGAASISLEKCGTSFVKNVPTAVANISAAVSADGSQASLTWDQDPLFSPAGYNIYRSSNLGTFFGRGNSTSQQFNDNEYSITGNYCYKIDYIDKCDNASPLSNSACPIRLTYTLSPTNDVTLNWSDYAGWANGVQQYKVEKFNLNGSLIKSYFTAATIILDNQIDNQNQRVTYRVTAIPNQAGVPPSISNTVEVYKQVNLFYPTAFTPDNKGPKVNETFFVGGQFIAKLELSIFDRWGSLIFYTDKNETWDGTLNGQPMPVATYAWRANVTDISGQTTQHIGAVVLIRK